MTKADSKLLNDIFLQPWFLPRKTALAIRRILPRQYWHKMSFYFEDYGCLKCGTKKVRHFGNALCAVCARRVKSHMAQSLQRRWKQFRIEDEAPSVLRILTAKQLLEDLIKPKKNSRDNPA